MKKASERRYFELVTTITTTTNNNSGSGKKVKYSCSQKSKREKIKSAQFEVSLPSFISSAQFLPTITTFS